MQLAINTAVNTTERNKSAPFEGNTTNGTHLKKTQLVLGHPAWRLLVYLDAVSTF
jgi:hypothetical protein